MLKGYILGSIVDLYQVMVPVCVNMYDVKCDRPLAPSMLAGLCQIKYTDNREDLHVISIEWTTKE